MADESANIIPKPNNSNDIQAKQFKSNDIKAKALSSALTWEPSQSVISLQALVTHFVNQSQAAADWYLKAKRKKSSRQLFSASSLSF